MTFAVSLPLELSSFFVINSSFSLQVSSTVHSHTGNSQSIQWRHFHLQWNCIVSLTLTHPRRRLPLSPLFQTLRFMMQDIERGLDASSSGSQHPVIATEKPVTEPTQSHAGSLTQKVKQDLLRIVQEQRKAFRRPRLLNEAPSSGQSFYAAFHPSRRSCESLHAACLSTIP
jgi:hypothetical protein